MVSAEDDREYVAETFVQGANESGFVKRKMMRRTLLLAAAPLGLLPVVLLRDLDNSKMPGAAFNKTLRHTVWGEKTKEGKPLRLVVEGTGQPIRAADFNSPGGILSVVPEGYEHDLNALAKATLILIKFRPEEIKSGTNQNWTHDGIVAEGVFGEQVQIRLQDRPVCGLVVAAKIEGGGKIDAAGDLNAQRIVRGL